jgi:hypothetical protein
LWADSLESGEFEKWLAEEKDWDEDQVREAVAEAQRRFGRRAPVDREAAKGPGGGRVGPTNSD